MWLHLSNGPVCFVLGFFVCFILVIFRAVKLCLHVLGFFNL